MECLGIFRDVVSAGQGVESLLRAGFTEAQITSLSSVPYPDGVLVKTERRTPLRWISLAGGFLGGGAGFSLAAGTAWLYPLQTGDKPIIALYPTAIITFELALLFAIVGTMVGMFLELRLPRWGKGLYDPSITAGNIGISVTIHGGGEVVECGKKEETGECIGMMAALPAAEQRERVEEIMRNAGALRIMTE